VRVAYVYANPRTQLLEAVARGEAPDTGLLGLNHLGEHGIDATVVLPRLRRTEPPNRVLNRLTWLGRELTLPWELGDADAAISPIANLLPLTARLRRRPRLLTLNVSLCNTYARASAPRRALLRSALRAAALVVCLATAQRDRLLRQTGVPPERVRSIPLGVDERFYEASPVPTAGYVLAVGRDLARDYGTFAEAVDGLGTRAIVVASPRNLGGVRLPEGVEVRRDVSYGELRDLYAGARCVVIPTRNESYPYGADCSGQTVLLDAMASARPVVLSRRATLDDYVDDGRTALIVPPEEPRPLREAIERVLADDALADELGSAARRRVEERHTTRQLAAAVAGLAREVAG
jgi:glycosyltransferase involved in cell wall biosynthesis